MCKAIVVHFKRGMIIPAIAKVLKSYREQVHRVIKRFKETRCIKDHPRRGRPRTTSTPALLKAWLRRKSSKIYTEVSENWSRSKTSTVKRANYQWSTLPPGNHPTIGVGSLWNKRNFFSNQSYTSHTPVVHQSITSRTDVRLVIVDPQNSINV